MRVLIVHEINYFDRVFFEFQDFAEGLAERGAEVSILDIREYKGEKPKRSVGWYRRFKGGIKPAQLEIRTPKPTIRNNLMRPLAVIQHLFAVPWAIARFRPDVIFSYSVPTSGLTVALLGRIFRVPVVHRAIDVSHLLRSPTLVPLVRLSEILTFGLSTSISTHNSALQSYIRKTTRDRKRVSIEYPPVYPFSASKKLEDRKTDAELRLIFIGTLARFTDLETILSSMAAPAGDWKIYLRIVGSGPREQDLKRISKSMGIEDRVEFRGWKDRKSIADELSWADIGIIPFKKSLLTDCALPQKAIEYLSAGLSVVSTRLEGAESVLGELQGMHFVESPSHILETCSHLASIGGLTSVDAELVRETFSREKTVEDIEKLLIRAVGLEDK